MSLRVVSLVIVLFVQAREGSKACVGSVYGGDAGAGGSKRRGSRRRCDKRSG